MFVYNIQACDALNRSSDHCSITGPPVKPGQLSLKIMVGQCDCLHLFQGSILNKFRAWKGIPTGGAGHTGWHPLLGCQYCFQGVTLVYRLIFVFLSYCAHSLITPTACFRKSWGGEGWGGLGVTDTSHYCPPPLPKASSAVMWLQGRNCNGGKSSVVTHTSSVTHGFILNHQHTHSDHQGEDTGILWSWLATNPDLSIP